MPTLSSVESESWLHTAGLGGEGAALHLTARDTRRQRTRLVLALISRAPPCHTSPGRGCLRAPAPGSAPRRVSRHTLCQTGYTALPAHTHALPAAARSRPPRRRCRARGSAALVPALPQTGGGVPAGRGEGWEGGAGWALGTAAPPRNGAMDMGLCVSLGNGAHRLEELPCSPLNLFCVISLGLRWIEMVSQCQEPGDSPVSKRQRCTRHGSEAQRCPPCPVPRGPATTLAPWRCSHLPLSNSPCAKTSSACTGRGPFGSSSIKSEYKSGQAPGKALGQSLQVAWGSGGEARTFSKKTAREPGYVRNHTLGCDSEGEVSLCQGRLQRVLCREPDPPGAWGLVSQQVLAKLLPSH